MSSVRQQLPGHEEITNFYRSVFTRAQMEADCIIMSLIYVERLIKSTNGELRPTASNWRSLLFSCMLLSSKVWDDVRETKVRIAQQRWSPDGLMATTSWTRPQSWM